MATPLEGRAYVVTGSGRGIGSEVAKLIGELGGSVVVNDPGVNLDGSGSDAGPAAEIAKIINDSSPGKAVANMDTVATAEGGENMIKQCMDEFGRLDGVIHVAGILRDRMVFNMTEEEWDAVIAVHLKGHFTTTRFATQVMRQQRSGRIINTSSESGLGNMGQANYSAAKEGIVGLTRTVARDMGKYGVTCNAIRPRAGTRLVLSPEMMEAAERAKAAGISGPQLDGMAELTPEQVAPLVVYLSTDEAAGVNGYDFLVGGGYVSLMSQPEETRTIWTSEGTWTVDELARKFPNSLGRGLVNPAPIPAAQG